ncbi:hypothetical protein Fmac_008258 [Flemingia macrophylla]|uniref:RNase H type-1 domain-containing protein n=1 Tax=Flemingia macrophylla TaxID=520843 RepID=A0ABD1MWX5_9FABA
MIVQFQRVFGDLGNTQPHVRFVRWEKPEINSVALNVNGSVMENGSMTEFGGLCRDHNDSFLFGFFGHLENHDILASEFKALEEGLQLCWEEGYISAGLVMFAPRHQKGHTTLAVRLDVKGERRRRSYEERNLVNRFHEDHDLPDVREGSRGFKVLEGVNRVEDAAL